MQLTRFSQHRDAKPFFNLTIHLPPFLFALSYKKKEKKSVTMKEHR